MTEKKQPEKPGERPSVIGGRRDADRLARTRIEKDEVLKRQLTVPKTERTRGESAVFCVSNLLVLPFIGLINASVSSEGLRSLVAVLATKLYKLPVPGFGQLKEVDGWNRLDLAHLTAIGLFLMLLSAWSWVVRHLMNGGDAFYEREIRTVSFYFKAILVAFLIAAELIVFYVGLSETGVGVFGDGYAVGIPLITSIYVAGMAWVAVWHNNYYYGVPSYE